MEISETRNHELTILMPCLNEAETVAACVRDAQEFLQNANIEGEVLVADNGSIDGSAEIAEKAGARVISVQEKGYGSALMGGIEAARGQYIIMGDADRSYNFRELTPFVEKLNDGNDLVMGNRFKGGIEKGAMPFSHKFIGNPILSAIGRLFFKSPIGDFHCGLRGFAKSSILRMDLRTTGMEFASEMVVKATQMRMRITEVPTTLSPAGRSRSPHLRTWQDGWRHLRFMMLYSPRWLFFYPGALAMVVGLLGMLLLLQGPQKIGTLTLDIHTLLYMASAIILGFQAIIFALFTKVFGISEGLQPADHRLDNLLKHIKLETGLFVGGLLLVVGTGLTIYAFISWGSASFGPLDPGKTFRLAIPAVVSLILGIQIILSSFFLSVLGLRRR